MEGRDMVDWVQRRVEGWGRFPVVTSEVARPETRAELRAAVAESGAVIPHGLGRSYGDAAFVKDGRVVMTRRLDRMLAFDAQTGWLEAEAGVSYEDLLRVFVPRGYFPPVTPGTKFVTLGGALACDVHGKNHHVDGSLSNHVRSFDLLLASGEVRRVTRESDPDLFGATVGGMGLTGIVLSLELKLTPIASPWIEMESVRVEDLDHFFAVSAESSDFTHTVSWIDCVTRGRAMGRGIFMRGRHAAPGVVGQTGLADRAMALAAPFLDVPLDGPDWLLNQATIKAFNATYFHRHPRGTQRVVQHYEPFFYPLDAVRHWNRIYGKRGFLQYQMVLPKDPDHRAIRAILDAITRSGFGSFLAVIKEFGPTDNGWLSFPKPGVTLALDFPNHGADLLALMDRLDAITLEAEGRVYLGKDARLGRDTFRRMYPGWERWKAVRDAVDPEGRFRSALGDRLGLTPRHGDPR
jgi:decaprenylphospho-beta-D-ribofuranose 2-oxidase